MMDKKKIAMAIVKGLAESDPMEKKSLGSYEPKDAGDEMEATKSFGAKSAMESFIEAVQAKNADKALLAFTELQALCDGMEEVSSEPSETV